MTLTWPRPRWTTPPACMRSPPSLGPERWCPAPTIAGPVARSSSTSRSPTRIPAACCEQSDPPSRPAIRSASPPGWASPWRQRSTPFWSGRAALSLVQVDQAAGERHGDRFGTVGHVQLCEDVLEMDLDGLVHPPDGLGHFLVAQPPGHQVQHLELTLGQVAPLGILGQPRRDAGRDHALPL